MPLQPTEEADSGSINVSLVNCAELNFFCIFHVTRIGGSLEFKSLAFHCI